MAKLYVSAKSLIVENVLGMIRAGWTDEQITTHFVRYFDFRPNYIKLLLQEVKN
jgi:hypothetical protein